MSNEYYSLGEIGRNKLNKKLKILTKTGVQILRPEDILATVDYLINLDYGYDFQLNSKNRFKCISIKNIS